jgi:beta-lactamase superfamily II metal-dependent hydrolase
MNFRRLSAWLTVIISLVVCPIVFGQEHYLRAYFLQYVPEGSSSTYGESIYFEFPGEDGILGTGDDRNLLIDGGRDSYAGQVLVPFLRERIGTDGVIWNMMNSSPGQDHYGGLQSAAENFEVKSFYQNVPWPAGDKSGYDYLVATLAAAGTDFYYYDAGDWLSGTDNPAVLVGPGWDPFISAKVLCANADTPYHGADDNRWAGLIQIRCGESAFLLGGDATGSSQEYWVVDETVPHSYPGARAELAETDIYKAHHHGSKYSSYPDFVDWMSPAYAVSQTAYGYGPGSHSHPAKEALDRIWSAGGVVYRNDLDGAVLVKCDSRGNFDITRTRAYVDEATTPGGSNDLVYPPPALPENLRVTGWGVDSISLLWDPVPGASGYDVFRSAVSGGDPGAGIDANPGGEPTGIYEKITTAPVTFSGYTDFVPAPGVTYYYRVSSLQVRSQDGYQVAYESRYSNQAAAASGGPTRSPTPPGWKTPLPTATPAPTATIPIPSPSATPSPFPRGPVVINEILADVPPGIAGDANDDAFRSSWEDEFVELVNWTGYTVNLGGSSLSDDWAIRYTFDHPFYLAPGQAVVVFGSGIPSGDFGGARVVKIDVPWGLSLTNGGDTVTLHNGEYIYDTHTYGAEGGQDRSLNRYPELSGALIHHDQVPGSEGRIYSPGTRADGSSFVYLPSPPPTSTPPPTPTASPTTTPTVTPTGTPSPTASPPPTPPPTPSVPPTRTPPPSVTPSVSPPSTATPIPVPRWLYDFDGDGTSDIALFRPESGLWSIRGLTRIYFGREGDLPVPADYTGDGTTEIAVFREDQGLWAVKGGGRHYFGRRGDHPLPADYSGDGTAGPAVFRSESGLWAVRYLTRVYFGGGDDIPVPGYYDRTSARPAIFRPDVGLWAIRGLTRFYYGSFGDIPVPGDYSGAGNWSGAVFGPESGLWAVRGLTRVYFGRPGDRPLPGVFRGDDFDGLGIFRPSSGLWAVRGLTRLYYGRYTDSPVTR